MKQNRIKSTPESFDQLIKSKLDEVKVNPTLADKYWQNMQLPSGTSTGISTFLSRYSYWFSASVILIVLFILIVLKKNQNFEVSHQKLDGRNHSKRLNLITNDDSLTVYKEVASNKQPESDVLPLNQKIIKPKLDEVAYERNKLLDKPSNDTAFFYNQRVGAANSINLFKEVDSLSNAEKEVGKSEIKPAEIISKKVDSLNKKTEERKKAPYIIW